MLIATGKLWRISWGKEANYGAGATCDGWLGIVQKFDEGDVKQEDIELRGIDTTLYPDQYIVSKLMGGGTITLNPQTSLLLAYAMGKDTVTGSESPYTHTIEVGDTYPSFALEVVNLHTTQSSSYKETYKGCKISSLTVDIAYEKLIEMAVKFVSQGLPTVSQGAPTAYNTTAKYKKKYDAVTKRPFLYSDTECKLNGNDIATLVSARIEINNNPIITHVCDSDVGKKIIEPFRGAVTFACEMRAITDLDTYKTIRDLMTENYLTGDCYIKITRGANDYIKFDLSPNDRLLISKISKPNDRGADKLEYTVTLRVPQLKIEEISDVNASYLT